MLLLSTKLGVYIKMSFVDDQYYRQKKKES